MPLPRSGRRWRGGQSDGRGYARSSQSWPGLLHALAPCLLPGYLVRQGRREVGRGKRPSWSCRGAILLGGKIKRNIKRSPSVCGEEPRGGRVSVHIPALSQVPGTCSHHKPQGGGCPTWRGADSRGCATWWGVDGRGCAKRQWSACRWGGHRPPGKQPTIPTRHGVSLLGEHPQHHAGQAMCCPSTFPASAPHYMVGTHLQP